ncbi:MAG TPA: TIGR00159 family protein [Candidatus Avimonoglobus intestinipullorum]|uniref:Diadenylate cyclase n=1 Tax=Candidatus Avimonoglobus intestinipullorum TaxID=2840699 RepID=A0A9D1S5V1_9FIRM|nr:TIGR00159 family protein [Candidatus Avimonoglobus intestinipullorum]
MAGVLDYISRFMQLIRVTDIIDIVIVAVLIYQLLKIIKETRAMQLVKGVFILFISLQLSAWLHFTVLEFILRNAMQVGMFAVIVIFQPELRSMLERVGRSKVGQLMEFKNTQEADDAGKTVNEIVEAAVNMSKSKTGALIVLERKVKLGDVINTGTLINADISAALLENIFVPNTPLHDGAVIIKDEKIHTAGCLLPLTSNTNLSRELGTRHRAALGISEASDAMVVVVSEETGKISLALNGTLTRNLTGDSLKKALTKGLKPAGTSDFDKIKFWKGAAK